MKILVINGPNLNMLGIREPEIYGYRTYKNLVSFIKDLCPEADVYQSNHEGDIIDKIQQAYGKYEGIIINPAGYTHTSIAIGDALKAVAIPSVEVHLSNINEREQYRKISFVRDACEKTFMGNGFDSYKDAIFYLYNRGHDT